MNFKEQIAKIILDHEISLELLDEFEPTKDQLEKMDSIEERYLEQ